MLLCCSRRVLPASVERLRSTATGCSSLAYCMQQGYSRVRSLPAKWQTDTPHYTIYI